MRKTVKYQNKGTFQNPFLQRGIVYEIGNAYFSPAIGEQPLIENGEELRLFVPGHIATSNPITTAHAKAIKTNKLDRDAEIRKAYAYEEGDRSVVTKKGAQLQDALKLKRKDLIDAVNALKAKGLTPKEVADELKKIGFKINPSGDPQVEYISASVNVPGGALDYIIGASFSGVKEGGTEVRKPAYNIDGPQYDRIKLINRPTVQVQPPDDPNTGKPRSPFYIPLEVIQEELKKREKSGMFYDYGKYAENIAENWQKEGYRYEGPFEYTLYVEDTPIKITSDDILKLGTQVIPDEEGATVDVRFVPMVSKETGQPIVFDFPIKGYREKVDWMEKFIEGLPSVYENLSWKEKSSRHHNDIYAWGYDDARYGYDLTAGSLLTKEQLQKAKKEIESREARVITTPTRYNVYVPQQRFSLKKEKGGILKKKIPLFELGGIIAAGVDHSQRNNIGDRGIPVVPEEAYYRYGGYNKEYKVAEVEQRELIIDRDAAQQIDMLVKEYDECKCSKKLIELGRLMRRILKNTKDLSCERTGRCDLAEKLKKVWN